MRYFYAISALRDKRARIAGEIEAAERKLAKHRVDLATIDATLRLFHPEADPSHITSIRPRWRGVYFRQGERNRLCLEAFRDAGGPLTQAMIAEYLMKAKGMDTADRPLRAVVVNNVGMVLYRLSRAGTVKRVITEPDVWWDLTG
jgi:hypothetical protein